MATKAGLWVTRGIMARRVLVADIADFPTIEAQGWGQRISARNTHYRSADPPAPDADSDAWCYAHFPRQFVAVNGGPPIPPDPPGATSPITAVITGAVETAFLFASMEDRDRFISSDSVLITGLPAQFNGLIDPATPYPIATIGDTDFTPSITIAIDTSAVSGPVATPNGHMTRYDAPAVAKKTTAKKTTAKKA